MKRDALLFEQKESGECTCLTCARECRISEGGKGWCATRIVQDGRPYTLTYGEVSSCSISPIESEPVFHFLPGSKWLALGSVGCNFRCPGCHNWEVAHWKGGDLQTTFVPPDELVAQALARGCRGITWAYNEPTLWLEYTLDCALLAKDAGLYTSYVTNGFLTWQSLEKLSPYLDVYRVDIKGFSDRTYQKFTSVKEWGTVLANTALAAQFGMHVEVITNVIPGVNDDLKELEDLAAWIE
ncbi:MAG: radical SAM protein, partial [Desulfovibrionales bacterium]